MTPLKHLYTRFLKTNEKAFKSYFKQGMVKMQLFIRLNKTVPLSLYL